jgi:hypothetical protein
MQIRGSPAAALSTLAPHREPDRIFSVFQDRRDLIEIKDGRS